MIISRLGADISFYKNIVYRKTHGYRLLKFVHVIKVSTQTFPTATFNFLLKEV